MKSAIFFILCLVFSASSWSYYEDNSEVQELVKAGRFEISFHSCEGELEADALIRADQKICLHHIPLPSAVEAEVGHMRVNELENESDYDQRITSLLHFSWKEFSKGEIELDDVLNLLSLLNIEANPDDISLANEVVDQESFPEFNELFVDLFFKVNSSTQDFINSSFKGELVQVVKFEEGAELYPGGGFYVSHYLVISAQHAMYIKLSWWNS